MSITLKLFLALVVLTAAFHFVAIEIIGPSDKWAVADYVSIGLASLSLISVIGEARRERVRLFLPFKENHLNAVIEAALRAARRERGYLNAPWTAHVVEAGEKEELAMARSWADEVIRLLESRTAATEWKSIGPPPELMDKEVNTPVMMSVRSLEFSLDQVNTAYEQVQGERDAASVKRIGELLVTQLAPILLVIALAIGLTTVTIRLKGLDKSQESSAQTQPSRPILEMNHQDALAC